MNAQPNADQPKAPESKPSAKDDLKSLSMPEVQAKLGSSPDGLSQAEAQKRLTQYGPNEIGEKKTNPFLKFLTYFWGPIPWMIEAAVVLSGVVRHWLDFLAPPQNLWVEQRQFSTLRGEKDSASHPSPVWVI